MNFDTLLKYIDCKEDNIRLIEIILPSIGIGSNTFYIDSDFENEYDKLILKGVPFCIDFFSLMPARWSSNKYTGSKIMHILFDSCGAPFIYESNINCICKFETLDEHNKKLIQVYQLINII